MERLRAINVDIEVDTNKDTYRILLEFGEEELLAAFAERIVSTLRERLHALDLMHPANDDASSAAWGPAIECASAVLEDKTR
jgi:hypothetical protein